MGRAGGGHDPVWQFNVVKVLFEISGSPPAVEKYLRYFVMGGKKCPES
jgi:hypothetical protein